MNRHVIIGIAAVALLGVTVHFIFGSKNPSTSPAGGESGVTEAEKPIGEPLYEATRVSTPTPTPAPKVDAEPIVIYNCRLTIFEKEEVPAQRDGVILTIGTEVADGEEVPPDLLIKTPDGRRYRRLNEGDIVKNGQLLAQLDDRLARAEWAAKKAKQVAAEADHASAIAAQNETRVRYERGQRLLKQNAIPQEELGERKLAWDTKIQEARAKKENVEVARLEAEQVRTVVTMHEIHSSIDGVIKTIYKNPGEAVKGTNQYESVFQIANLNRLRIEGLVDEQTLPRLRVGDEMAVEAPAAQGPVQPLVGHLQEVTAVAVARGNSLIASASLDGTVRIWQRGVRREHRIFHHPGPVLSVACSPGARNDHYCLSGGADGTARLWDLASTDLVSHTPLRAIPNAHKGPIHCVAFSPDGSYFATGGDDREIAVWETATGTLKYRLLGHSGAVTMVTFTPQVQLVSAARDNTIRVWALGTDGGRVEATLPRRSGDVSQPGVSPDGTRVLFDPWQSKRLRLLTLPDGMTEAELEEPSGAARLTTFALFSPDASMILTAGGAEGRLQLWQPQSAHYRPHIRRYLVSPQRGTPTCAACAPDSSFFVVGTRDRQVLIFPRDCPEDQPQALKARISHIEHTLDSNQARVWATLNNPGGRLLPGATVTMVRYPK